MAELAFYHPSSSHSSSSQHHPSSSTMFIHPHPHGIRRTCPYVTPPALEGGWRLSLPPPLFPHCYAVAGVREMLSELSSRSIATDGFIQLLADWPGGKRGRGTGCSAAVAASKERSTPPSSFLHRFPSPRLPSLFRRSSPNYTFPHPLLLSLFTPGLLLHIKSNIYTLLQLSKERNLTQWYSISPNSFVKRKRQHLIATPPQ